jgi:hypothetical protein
MKQIFVVTLALILLASISLAQVAPPQTSSGIPPGTLISAELSKAVDGKRAKAGDKVEAKTVADVIANSQLLIPKGTKITGHITSAKARNRDSQDSTVGMVFDTLSTKSGEVIIQTAIQAIGPVQPPPNYGVRSGFPIAGKTGPTPSGGWGEPPATVPALDASSKGIVGMNGLALSRSGQASVVSSSNETVHLEIGTQLILRIEESL